MDDLKSVLDQLITEEPREPMSDEEANARSAVIAALFATKGTTERNSEDLALRYAMSTDDIPFGVLALAVKGLIRTHPYKDVPAIADIWKAARHIAGMHREQHCPGSGYLPPPKKWPPEGKRYGVCYGEYETLPIVSVKALAAPQGAERYLGEGVDR